MKVAWKIALYNLVFHQLPLIQHCSIFYKKMLFRVPHILGEFNGKICSECISYNLEFLNILPPYFFRELIHHQSITENCWMLKFTDFHGRKEPLQLSRAESSHWWRPKLNIKKWNAILYKTNTYIFALRKTTTIQLTVNNIFISILFDFRMQIIQPGTVAMAPSPHGSQ